MHGALAVHEVLLRVERLAGRAVPALVRGRVEVARRVDAPDDLLDAHAVPRLGRADEVVVRDPELFPEVPERRRVAVGDDDRRDAFLLRDLLDVLAVLVGAGQEAHVLAREAEIAGERVRDDRRVEVPDVGPVVDVVDRGREVAARHEESRIPRRRYGRRIARTRAAILSPIASEAVAAGDGAFRTWSTRPCVDDPEIVLEPPVGTQRLRPHAGSARLEVLRAEVGHEALQGLHERPLAEGAVHLAEAHAHVLARRDARSPGT